MCNSYLLGLCWVPLLSRVLYGPFDIEAENPCLKAAPAFVHRPVPTPCRALSGRCPPFVPCAEDDSPVWNLCEFFELHTLLDDCASVSDDWAFNAATLLDTLIEHFQEEKACEHGSGPVRLSLADTVPITSFQRDCLELQRLLPPSRCHWDSACDWLDNDYLPLLHFKGATLSQRTALANVRRWHQQAKQPDITEVIVYTDGSAAGASVEHDTAPAGWAFSVWLSAAGQTFFYGAAYGTAVPPGTAYHVGESQDTPLQSELLAICWSLAWLLEYGGAFGRPVRLLYDCQSAGFGTFGVSKPAAVPLVEGTGSLSRFAAILRQCVERRLCLSAAYIPGHAGFLGNEMSDCFAKFARAHPQPLDDRLLPEWPGLLARHPLADWAWHVIEESVDLPRLYALEAAAACSQKEAIAHRPAPCLGLIEPHRQPSAVTTDVSFCLRLMTYNVLTLLDKPRQADRPASANVGMMMKGKRHLIVQQCHQERLNFMASRRRDYKIQRFCRTVSTLCSTPLLPLPASLAADCGSVRFTLMHMCRVNL